MTIVGQVERATQDRVVRLFVDTLHYDYYGHWQDRRDNHNVEEDYLRGFLQSQGHADALIAKVLHLVNRVAGDQSRSLYDINKDMYSLLRYGVQVKPEADENNVTVWLVDWHAPQNNQFAIAEEVTVHGRHTKRPDIVLYLNGIAIGVLELKRSIVSVAEGIRQNLDNQKPEFIERFFTTMQLVMAGNDTEGLRYGTIQTPEKYYLTWKEEGADPSPGGDLLDQQIVQLCAKDRLLELIHDFVVYDAGTKKLCRHNQYFGVRAAQARIRQREGGIIWHTQGSGKSLTMVWLAKWLLENIRDSRVLIITDRTELDEQIEKVFRGVQEQITRTDSGRALLDSLNAATPRLICSLIHKFAGTDDENVAGYMTELHRSLPGGFQPKGDLYVFVDECHRTQSGELNQAMRQILPNAVFIGFTGTPLLKIDKQKSIEVFGSYIHTYKYNQAVADGVVLDLRYEARDIDQNIKSQARIDQWFEAKTKGLNAIALAQLKKKWGTLQKVLSSRSRLEMIVADILLDMEERDRLKSGRGNALLVSGNIYQACKLYELFIASGFDRCAIVTSYKGTAADIKGEETGEGDTEKLDQHRIYQRMLNGQDTTAFEQAAKQKFIEEPGQMKLLIVVDKLLTGFDAPPATYLYIDKQMRDHGLFQAICRVNRLDGDDKEYGYIIDYKDLFQSLAQSVQDYTSGALDGYDKADVAGLLTDRLGKARQRLEDAREAIKALCEPVALPRGTADYMRYFCAGDTADPEALKGNESKRVTLYTLTVSLIRAYANLANEMPEAGYSQADIDTIQREVDYYEKLRTEIKIASGDYIDLKLYEPAMRHLIDSYIRAEDSQKISAFDNMTLIQLIVDQGPAALDQLPAGIASDKEAVAETIENNLRRIILDEQPINPKYYEKMSELLDALIKERKAGAFVYEQYLTHIMDLSRQVINPASGTSYPKVLDTGAKRALYDNLDNDEALALALDAEIMHIRKDGWRGNRIKEREVQHAIHKHLNDQALTEQILELVKQQSEY